MKRPKDRPPPRAGLRIHAVESLVPPETLAPLRERFARLAAQNPDAAALMAHLEETSS